MAGERPIGVPISCVVRIRPGDPDTSSSHRVQVDGKLIRLGPSNSDIYSFSEVYGASTSQEELFNKEVRKLVKTAADGYSAAVLTLGQTESGKSFTLEGDNQFKNGVISLAVHDLFDLLKKKVASTSSLNQAKGRSRYDTRQSSFQVAVQYVEVVDDTVRDLLAQSQEATLVVEAGEYGTQISGATVQEIRHPDDFDDLFIRSQQNRTTTVGDFGPLADKASVMLILDVEQRMAPSFERIVSRLFFVILPGTEKLLEDPDTVRVREGVRLNREILAFGSLVKALSSQQTSDFADYSQSKTNLLLDDVLGGNCFTLCIATLNPGDINGSRGTLEHAKMMSQIVNFPIHNDERAMGILRRLRLQLVHLHQEAREHGDNHGQVADTQMREANEAVILDLKGKLVRSDLDRAKLIKDKEKLLDRYAVFREKYTDLVGSKANLQAELIKAEEERLKLSKMLIDLQMENTELKEQTISEKYDLEAKVLTMENGMVEREAKEQKLMEENMRLKKQVEELIEEKKDVSLEYVALKQNYTNMLGDMELKKREHSDIAAELLTLENAKNTLTAQNRDLEGKLKHFQEERKELVEYKDKADLTVSQQRERIQLLLAENERFKLETVRKDVELTKTVSEFESMRTGLEKNYVQMAMDRNKELQEIRAQKEQEKAAVEAKYEELQKDIARLSTELKLAHRRAEEVEIKLNEQLMENSDLNAEVEKLNQHIHTESEKFRLKLLEYVTDIQEATSVVRQREIGEDGDGSAMPKQTDQLLQDLSPATDKMYQDMLQTHTTRERELLDRCEKYRQRVKQLIHMNRELTARLRTLQRFAEDVTPQGVSVPAIDEKEWKQLTAGSSEEEKQLENELQQAKENIQTLRGQLSHQKQLTLTQAENFQKNSATLQKEYVRLKEECAQLRQNQTPISATMLMENKKAVEELQSFLEKKFVEQVRDLRQQERDKMHELQDQLEILRKDNEKLRNRAPEKAGPDSARAQEWKEAEDSYKERIRTLQQTISDLKDAGAQAGGAKSENVGELKRQMKEFQINTQRELEKERAQLKVRAVQAEEELKTFQEYMRAEIPKYQQKIMELNKEVTFCRNNHRKAGLQVGQSTEGMRTQPVAAWPENARR